MKKRIKTGEISALYTTLCAAKYGDLSTDEIIKVFNIMEQLKPVAVGFAEAGEQAAKMLKDKFPGYDENLQRALEYQEASQGGSTEGLSMGAAEYKEWMRSTYQPYQNMVVESMKERTNKMAELTIDTIDIQTVVTLAKANGWNGAQMMLMRQICCK